MKQIFNNNIQNFNSNPKNNNNIYQSYNNINKINNNMAFKIFNNNMNQMKNNMGIHLNNKMTNPNNELLPGEKWMSVDILSVNQKVHTSVICKNTDLFINVELKVYEQYPKYKEVENYFTVNGIKINKYKSMDENKIKNNDKILLNHYIPNPSIIY